MEVIVGENFRDPDEEDRVLNEKLFNSILKAKQKQLPAPAAEPPAVNTSVPTLREALNIAIALSELDGEDSEVLRLIKLEERFCGR